MNNQLQFRISQYVYLARLCDEADPKKQEYMQKAEELLEELQENIRKAEEDRKMQNYVYRQITFEREARLIRILEEILHNAKEEDFEDMTVSRFMEYYPSVRFASAEQVGKALTAVGVMQIRKVIDGTQQRVRYLPKPKNRT